VNVYSSGADVVLKGMKMVDMKMIIRTITPIIELTPPRRSPKRPIAKRPAQEQAPRMARRVYPSSAEKPAPVEMVGRRPPIPKTTNSIKKTPQETNAKAGFLHADRFSADPEPLASLCVVESEQTSRWKGRKQMTLKVVTHPTTRATILIDQAHPRVLKVDRRRRGNMMEPSEVPMTAVPMAKPRRRTNSLPTTPIAVVQQILVPILPKTPKQSMNCQ
jgi:hypothetical protein